MVKSLLKPPLKWSQPLQNPLILRQFIPNFPPENPSWILQYVPPNRLFPYLFPTLKTFFNAPHPYRTLIQTPSETISPKLPLNDHFNPFNQPLHLPSPFFTFPTPKPFFKNSLKPFFKIPETLFLRGSLTHISHLKPLLKPRTSL